MKKTILSFCAAAIVFCSCNTNRELAPAYGSSGSFGRTSSVRGSSMASLDYGATQNAYQKSSASISGKPMISESGDDKENQKKMIIYDAWLSLAVKQPDSVNKEITKITAGFGGYVQSMGNNGTVIRVKSENLYPAIEAISKLGKVAGKNISSDDVTDSYFDMSIRLDNAEKARKRYQELLEKAQNVDEALKVEKELERLNTDIDLLKGRMSKMQHLAEYSTITVYVYERKKPGILGYVGIGLYKLVKWFFVRN